MTSIPETIPDDIREKAKALALGIDEDAVWGDGSDWGIRFEVVETMLAAALLAERKAQIEACAKIADGTADEKGVMAMEACTDSQVGLYREGERTANQIASAIRSQLK